MAIARTGWNQIYTTGVEDPVSGSLALGSTAGRAVVAFMAVPTAYVVSGASITSGDALTQVDMVDVDGFKRYLFAGLVTQTGSQTVTFDTTAPAGQLKWGAVASYEDVTAIRSGGDATSGSSGTNPSITLTTVSGDMVVMLGISNGAAATLSAAGGATDFDGGAADAIALQLVASSASTTISGTWSANSAWYAGAVALQGAAAAPVLTSPTAAATGNTTANAGATIDAVSGSGSRIMYARPRIGGSQASSATIISTGTQLAVTSAGANLVPLTGLTTSATYVADVVYVDATLGTSNVVTTGSFTPADPITATLAGTLDTLTGAVVAGAAAITANFAGTLDTITGAVLAGGTTGRLTSALPLRDGARVTLANRTDVAVHVMVKPGLGSVIVLSAQAIASGIWTAAGPFTPGTRYNVLYEVGGEPIGCEIITATTP